MREIVMQKRNLARKPVTLFQVLAVRQFLASRGLYRLVVLSLGFYNVKG